MILRHFPHFQAPTVVACTVGWDGTGTSVAIVEVAEEMVEGAAGSFSAVLSVVCLL